MHVRGDVGGRKMWDSLSPSQQGQRSPGLQVSNPSHSCGSLGQEVLRWQDDAAAGASRGLGEEPRALPWLQAHGTRFVWLAG